MASKFPVLPVALGAGALLALYYMTRSKAAPSFAQGEAGAGGALGLHTPVDLKLPGENGAVFLPEMNGAKLAPGRIFITREPRDAGDPPAARYTAASAIHGSTVSATGPDGSVTSIPVVSISQLIGADV